MIEVTDLATLRDRFHVDRLILQQRAIWAAGDPGAPPEMCRYCGNPWKCWKGSKLDGHARCYVTAEFKRYVLEYLQSSPLVTYTAIAAVLELTPSVIRSWTYPIRSGR